MFLVDWNRARKRLRKLAPKRVCLEVLRWAAENDYGHKAFLKLGGERLVAEALQLSRRVPSQMGQQLADMIGPDQAMAFLKYTLKTASLGLRSGRSEPLIRDQIRAELRNYLETAHQGLLERAAEHAGLIVELAMAARDCLMLTSGRPNLDYVRRASQRAKRWEHLADNLVTEVRNAQGDLVESKAAAELVRIADSRPARHRHRRRCGAGRLHRDAHHPRRPHLSRRRRCPADEQGLHRRLPRTGDRTWRPLPDRRATVHRRRRTLPRRPFR